MLRFTNDAPAYWAREGGAQWTCHLDCPILSVCLCAQRSSSGEVWQVLDGNSNADSYTTLPSHYDDTRVWEHLTKLIQERLQAALAHLQSCGY